MLGVPLTGFCCCSIAKSCLTLQPHGLQQTRVLHPPLSPGVCSNSCPLNQGCCLTISSSGCPSFLLLPSGFPSIRVVSSESALPIRWPKSWSSFSISPSNEYSGLISFRIDWFDFLEVQGLSRVFSSTTIQKDPFFSIHPSYDPTLTSV